MKKKIQFPSLCSACVHRLRDKIETLMTGYSVTPMVCDGTKLGASHYVHTSEVAIVKLKEPVEMEV